MNSRLARPLGIFFLLACSFFDVTAFGQTQSPPAADAPQQTPAQQSTGSINGTVVDSSGAVIVGARVTLTRADQSGSQEVLTGGNGSYSFSNVAPGDFQIAIAARSFASQKFSGTLQAGQAYEAPRTVLARGSADVVIQVGAPTVQVAEQQIKVQEKQRVLAFVPNFYVTYVPDPAPLNSKQKFELAWKQSIDPITFVLAGALAGVEQWQNYYSGYGQGAEGFGKRFGSSYADSVTSTLFGSAIFPSLLKQDPRYFYKGTGTKRSRFLHAVASAVICKGDNQRWQPNYSSILGTLSASGLSNTYYPKNERGAALTFENAAVGTGANAVMNLMQEFVVRKLTPNTHKPDPAQPNSGKTP